MVEIKTVTARVPKKRKMIPKHKQIMVRRKPRISIKKRQQMLMRQEEEKENVLEILPDELLLEVFSFIAGKNTYCLMRSVCLHWSIVLDTNYARGLVYKHDVSNSTRFKALHGEVGWDQLFQWASVQLDATRRLSLSHRLSLRGVPKHLKLMNEVRVGDIIALNENDTTFYRVVSPPVIMPKPLTERGFRRDNLYNVQLANLSTGVVLDKHIYGYDTIVYVFPEPWEYKQIRVLHGSEGGRKFFLHETKSQPIGCVTLPRGKFGDMLAACETYVNLYSSKRNLVVLLECFVRGDSEIEMVGFSVKYVRRRLKRTRAPLL